jgi:hypothetical protein
MARAEDVVKAGSGAVFEPTVPDLNLLTTLYDASLDRILAS